MDLRNFRVIEPYTPGDQPRFADMIKLNTNENPYPPCPGVIRAAAEFDCDLLRLYPPVDAGDLRRAIADYHGLDASRIFVGVGSDDVLADIFMSCFNSGESVLFPEISYSFYDVWAEMFKVPYRRIPLKEGFTIDPEDYLGVANGGVVIANPNAPTSLSMGLADIEKIIAGNPERVVVIDEAYVDFGGESALPLIEKYDNLVVVRTFSKSRSMAGMRIGYAIASEQIIRAMEDVKYSINSYTINMPAVRIGLESLADEKYFRDTIEKIVNTRAVLVRKLAELGFSTPPSSTNFIFTTHESVPAQEIYEKLKEKHIYVRFFNKPLINNYLRITVGTDEQTEALITALKDILK